jgi:hypothetical protein
MDWQFHEHVRSYGWRFCPDTDADSVHFSRIKIASKFDETVGETWHSVVL